MTWLNHLIRGLASAIRNRSQKENKSASFIVQTSNSMLTPGMDRFLSTLQELLRKNDVAGMIAITQFPFRYYDFSKRTPEGKATLTNITQEMFAEYYPVLFIEGMKQYIEDYPPGRYDVDLPGDAFSIGCLWVQGAKGVKEPFRLCSMSR